MRTIFTAAALVLGLAAGGMAQAQSFDTGQSVYASPSGAASDWYSGCVVKDGRSNASFQVQCGGTTYWISDDHIRTSPPTPIEDPMRPGHMLTPTITPSRTPGAAAGGSAAASAARTPATAGAVVDRSYRQINGGVGPGSYARSATPPAPARSLKIGNYPCWAGRTPAGFAMNIRSSSGYDDGAGHGGAFRYDAGTGKLQFVSGPYAGWSSIVYGDGSIGLSQPGRNNYGTQCYPG